jgi:ATP adenylyltransferase
MAYVSDSGGSEAEAEDCFFCAARASSDDAASYVLHRSEGTFALLNAFPYNTGHLMVAPLRHAAALDQLDATERGEVMELTTRAITILQEVMHPDGFNVGMNLGAVAGAGVPGHLHVHVVPRWGGDTNFMPVVGKTKVLPEALDQTYAKLRSAFG